MALRVDVDVFVIVVVENQPCLLASTEETGFSVGKGNWEWIGTTLKER